MAIGLNGMWEALGGGCATKVGVGFGEGAPLRCLSMYNETNKAAYRRLKIVESTTPPNPYPPKTTDAMPGPSERKRLNRSCWPGKLLRG